MNYSIQVSFLKYSNEPCVLEHNVFLILEFHTRVHVFLQGNRAMG